MSFIPTPGVLIAFAAASLLLAATPGPDMALFLSNTLAGGRRFGFAALGGALTGLLVHASAAALGLSALLAASASAYGALKLLGAAYLLWLAFSALRHGAQLHIAGEGGSRRLSATFLRGVLINLTNPKIIIFFVTFLPQFVDAADPNARGELAFLGLGFMAIGAIVNVGIILIASRFVAAARANPKAMRYFDYGLAALMSAFAARLILAQGR